MKKLLFIVLLFISVQSFAQVVQYPTNYGIGYRRVGADTLLWCPIDTFSVPASLSSKSHLARKGTTLYYWNGAAWAAFAGGGGGTYYNANVGSAYRLAIPNTNNIKTLSANYGIILDSATSNQIGVKFDSATVFPQVRATLPTPTWQQVLTSGSRLTTTNSINGAGYNFTWDSLGNYTQYIRGAGKQFTFNTYNNSNSLTSDFEQYEGGFYLSGTEPVSGNDIWFNMETNNVGGTFEVIDAGTYGNSYLTNYGSNSTYETQHYLEDITSTNRKYSGIYQKIGVNNNTTFYTQIENVISNKVYNQIYMDSLNGIQLQTKTALANTYKGLKIDKTHQVFIDSMATGGASADSVVVITSGGQLKKRDASTFTGTTSRFGLEDNSGSDRAWTTDGGSFRWVGLSTYTDSSLVYPLGVTKTGDTLVMMNGWPVGSGGGTPAGNYGNVQLNRNGAFATPSTDTLGYTTSGGFAVKNKITATAGGTFNSSNSSTGDFVVNGQTVNNLLTVDASSDEVFIGTATDNGAYKLQVAGDILLNSGSIKLTTSANTRIDYNTNAIYVFGNSSVEMGTGSSTYAMKLAGGKAMVGSGTTPTMTLQVDAGRFGQAKGAAVASANNLTLGADGNTFHITGTTQINAITVSNWQAGSIITLIFDSTPTVKNNTAGGGGTAVMLLAGGVDFAATANDVLRLVYDGTSWFEVSRSVN